MKNSTLHAAGLALGVLAGQNVPTHYNSAMGFSMRLPRGNKYMSEYPITTGGNPPKKMIKSSTRNQICTCGCGLKSKRCPNA